MNEEQRASDSRNETTFSRQVGAQAARKLKARRRGPEEHLVRPGHVGAGRLVRDDSDPDRRGARYLGGQALSESVFMDADAAFHGFDRRLSQCLALGRTRNTRKCRRTRMSDILALTLALLAGVLLGAFFFGGLWWTVQKGVTSETPGALVPRQPAAANRCDPGRILSCVAGSLVEARGVPAWISDRARHRREAAHTSAGGRADSIGRGDLHCALLPMTWSSGGAASSSSIARSSRPGC